MLHPSFWTWSVNQMFALYLANLNEPIKQKHLVTVASTV